MGCSSSQTAPAWVPSMGCSPSGTGCSSVGPPWGHKSCQQTCFSVGCSLCGSTGPGRSLLQHRFSVVSQPPSGIHLLQCWVLHGLQVDLCSTVDLQGLQGHSLSHHGLLHGPQGNLCSGAWSTSSPSFFTNLGVCRVISLMYSHSSLLLQFFFPFLKYIITDMLPPSLMGLVLASSGSILEPAGTGSVRHRGSFQQLLTEATPVASPLPKPCSANPIQKLAPSPCLTPVVSQPRR